MRITLLQTLIEPNSVIDNLSNLKQLLSSNETDGDLVVLPELFTSGYLLESPSLMSQAAALSTSNISISGITSLADTFNTTILLGLPELVDATVFNSAFLIDRNGVRAVYRKISQTLIDRTFFGRGDRVVTFKHSGLLFGVVICFDIWFPEITRQYAQLGIDVLIHISNFGGPQSHAIALTRAIENGVYVLTCNRVGHETLNGMPVSYCGGSRVISPNGEILATADGESQMSISYEILDSYRRTGTVIGVDLATEINQIRCQITKHEPDLIIQVPNQL